MGNAIAFAGRLAVDGVLLIGLLVCAGYLYRYCLKQTRLQLDRPCRAKIVTVISACFTVWLMSRGFKGDFDGVLDMLSFIAYVGAFCVGAAELWRRRGMLQDEARRHFPD